MAAAWGFVGVLVALMDGGRDAVAGWLALALGAALLLQTLWLRRRQRPVLH